jgi:hypothetical protein
MKTRKAPVRGLFVHFLAKRFGANHLKAYLCTAEREEGFRTTAGLFSFCLTKHSAQSLSIE